MAGVFPNIGFGAFPPPPGPFVVLTHPAAPGFLPTGLNIVMCVVCFNIPGASNVTLTFNNRFGGTRTVVRAIVCPLAVPAAAPAVNQVENELSSTITTSSADLSLASSTESTLKSAATATLSSYKPLPINISFARLYKKVFVKSNSLDFSG